MSDWGFADFDSIARQAPDAMMKLSATATDQEYSDDAFEEDEVTTYPKINEKSGNVGGIEQKKKSSKQGSSSSEFSTAENSTSSMSSLAPPINTRKGISNAMTNSSQSTIGKSSFLPQI